MPEYIEREAIKYEQWSVGPLCEPLMVVRKKTIDALPAADVEPVRHGRWKYYHKQNKAVCTNCSFERDLDANFGRAISCPNCGAKMDLEERSKT